MQHGASLPVGEPNDDFTATAVPNAEGSHALVIGQGERPMVLVSAGRDARAGRLLVTALDDSVELRTDREAAAQWIARGSVARRVARAPAWANATGFVLVVVIFALTVLGAVTVIGWVTSALSSP